MTPPKIRPAAAYALTDLAGTAQSVYLHHNTAMDAVSRARGGVVEDLVARSQVQALELEAARLRDREACCPTLAEAEARAMLRALQEIAAIVGLPMSATPAEVVEAVGLLGVSRDMAMKRLASSMSQAANEALGAPDVQEGGAA